MSLDRLAGVVVLHHQAVPLQRPYEAWRDRGEAGTGEGDLPDIPFPVVDLPAAVVASAMRVSGDVERSLDRRMGCPSGRAGKTMPRRSASVRRGALFPGRISCQ